MSITSNFQIANHLTGWSQIKNIPLQQHIIPVKISPDYSNIKSQIRQSVILSNAFQQDDLSSLQEKDEKGSVFQIQQLGVVSRKDNQNIFKHSRLSHGDKNLRNSKQSGWQEAQKESRRLSHSNIKKNHNKNQIFFGQEPKFTQSNMIQQQKPQNSKTRINYVISPKFSCKNIFKEFADQKPHNFRSNTNHFQIKQPITKQNPSFFKQASHDDSYQLNFNNMSHSHKSFKTANKQSFTKQNAHYNQQSISFNKRNMEFIIMAVIAAFFVALGSNLGKMFTEN